MLVTRARTLRENQTKAEQLLWSALRNRQLGDMKFRRQHPAPPYILDFFCEEKKLAIELDGGHHNNPENAHYDEMRTALLNQEGISVLRFWNQEIFDNLDGVLATILDRSLSPHPAQANLASLNKPSHPSPDGRGQKRVCLGKITGAHGVKGLVKIMPFGEDPYLIEEIKPLFTAAEGDATIELTLKHPQGSHFLADVKGVTDRDQAEALRGTELYVPRDALPDIEDEDSYYIEDLVGLEARDEDGTVIGPVLAVHNFGAGDLLEIRGQSGESFMLPFTNDTVGDVGDFIVIKDFKEFLN